MLSAGLWPGKTRGGTPASPRIGTFIRRCFLFFSLFVFISVPQVTPWPYDYRYLYNHCPGPEWNIMCRGCCEYDVIRCKCPLQGTPVGYAVPCCRNAINECDPCIVHPGCSIFENCKRCNNGTWGPRDDFFIRGQYCSECRPGWSGGDCMKCGGVIRKRQGHLVLESYPNNARCQWTIQVDQPFTIELRFMMISLESHQSCQYDYIEVRDGDSVRSRVIGRFCGNSRPGPIQSSGNSLHILFVSDGYKNFDGFFATFQENSACSSSPCLHDGTCILDTSYTYHCACLAGFTGKRCENVLGCHRPPVPTHGFTEGSFYHSGARIYFHCDSGFELQGFPSAICLSDGTWSAPAPQCVQSCSLPPKPNHGDHFLVYGPNDVLIALQYLCFQPYELSGSSQRTCLSNDTWSGTPPVCTKVNNTLIEEDGAETHVHKEKTDHGNKKMDEDVTRGDTFTGNTPEKTASEERNEGESEIPNEGSDREVDGEVPDRTSNTIQQEVTPGPKPEDRKWNITETVVRKGQTEKERKEEQVNGKRGQEDVGPNDTKAISPHMNNTSVDDTNGETTETKVSRTPERKHTSLNVTLYRAGGEEKATSERKDEDKEKEKEVNQSYLGSSCPPLPRLHHGHHKTLPGVSPETVQFTCNHSYALGGDATRRCRPDGTWSGAQPLCVRACREPKVSELVRQKVLPPQAPFRKTPVHRFYSSTLTRLLQADLSPTKPPPVTPQLPPGFRPLYTHIEYECVSPFYHHNGSSRRTCLKTGKWSGRHVSCSPVCGKHPTFDPERPAEAHWPWLAAIYRLSTDAAKTKVTKADGQTVSLKSDSRPGPGKLNPDWQLVCSGALVNQRSIVVAAHCVTELGKVYPLDVAKIKVVVGKYYRDDQSEQKGLQHLRVTSLIIHQNYDPHILDSDIAVIKLLDKAKIGEKVSPLCLSDSPGEGSASGQGLVTGWSPLPDPSLGGHEKARVGLVGLADVVPCEQQYARHGVPVSVTENMLCASQKPDYGASNICPSDTGGILVLPALPENNHKQYYGFSKGERSWKLLGLVSFGYDQGECDPDLYTVFTRTSEFKDWIESNMR